ncbi:MAG TPA: hypothetical protein VLW49_09185 [Gaiellaceae bacterium]|nr:hypothetical protein [Gaiellaceae bacterium]
MSAPSSIELLARIAPVSDEEAAEVLGPAARARLLVAIMRQSPGRTRPARRRLRRPLVAALAVVAVAAATGAGWAMTRGSARETTTVDCLIDGESTVIDATSGDPASDCAAVWPAPAPKLQAYDDGIGGVVVIPASQKPRAGWTAIASQDVALIELQESLDDNINGLDSSCFDASAATTFARQQLDRLGLIGWTVQVRSSSQTGQSAPCYGGFAQPEAKTVTLMPFGDQSGPASWPPHRLADSLRPLTQECLSLPAMKSEVEQRASSLGLSQTVEGSHNYELNSTEDDTMRCATVYETVGGTIDVVLRGPSAP